LKQKLIEGEKQAQVLNAQTKVRIQLQAELADARKMNVEMNREVQSVTASRAEIEQAVIVFNTRLATVQTNANALTEQAGVIKQVQADLENEKKARAATVEQLEKEKAIVDASEKEKTLLQTRIAELEKQVAEGAVQQKALETKLEKNSKKRVKSKQ